MVLISIVVVVIIVAAVLGYGAYAGWFKTSSSSSGFPACNGTPTLSGAGSTFVYPIMSLWTFNYHSASGCAQINYASVGSGTGISDFTSKLVNYGASDAPPNYLQVKAFPAQALVMPDAAGAVAVMFNLKGVAPGGLNLTGSIVAQIYLGNITNWDNPAITTINPHLTLPNATIVPTARSDGSGTSYAFSGFLTQDNAYWSAHYGQNLQFPTLSGVVYQRGSTGVAGFVASTPDSIGYAELNYAETGGVNYAAIANPSGAFIVPSVATTAPALEAVGSSLPAGTANWSSVSVLNQGGAGAYPIATMTYLLIYEDVGIYGSSFTQNDAEWLVNFLTYIVTTGQNQATALFYVPLSASIVANCMNTISLIKYNGASIPTFSS
jgi:phosphate ABC transporter phosphate-binding protein